MRLSTKQYIVILLAQPLNLFGWPLKNPTLRDICRGLREHFSITCSIRHIRRLLTDLEHEGIISREIGAWHFGPSGNQAQATRYSVVDFDRAFQNDLSLPGRAKVIVARERRPGKRKEARA